MCYCKLGLLHDRHVLTLRLWWTRGESKSASCLDHLVPEGGVPVKVGSRDEEDVELWRPVPVGLEYELEGVASAVQGLLVRKAGAVGILGKRKLPTM